MQRVTAAGAAATGGCVCARAVFAGAAARGGDAHVEPAARGAGAGPHRPQRAHQRGAGQHPQGQGRGAGRAARGGAAAGAQVRRLADLALPGGGTGCVGGARGRVVSTRVGLGGEQGADRRSHARSPVWPAGSCLPRTLTLLQEAPFTPPFIQSMLRSYALPSCLFGCACWPQGAVCASGPAPRGVPRPKGDGAAQRRQHHDAAAALVRGVGAGPAGARHAAGEGLGRGLGAWGGGVGAGPAGARHAAGEGLGRGLGAWGGGVGAGPAGARHAAGEGLGRGLGAWRARPGPALRAWQPNSANSFSPPLTRAKHTRSADTAVAFRAPSPPFPN